MSTIDIHQYVAKKKVASEAEPSRPSKKGRVVTPSALVRKSDILSESVSELVLALSALTTLPEVPSTEDGAAKKMELQQYCRQLHLLKLGSRRKSQSSQNDPQL